MPRALSRTVKRRKHSTRPIKYQHPHPHAHTTQFWIIATILAFPFVMTVSQAAGYGTAFSFAAGAIGSLLVLALNAALEWRVWMMHSHWRDRFEDPAFSFRLALVMGAILLMIETTFLTFFLLDNRSVFFANRVEANSVGCVSDLSFDQQTEDLPFDETINVPQ